MSSVPIGPDKVVAASFLQDGVREGREAREAGAVGFGLSSKLQWFSHFAVVRGGG